MLIRALLLTVLATSCAIDTTREDMYDCIARKRFEYDSEGPQLHCKALGGEHPEGCASLRLEAESFVPGKKYTLCRADMRARVTQLEDFFVDDEGSLISMNPPHMPLSEMTLSCNNFMNGEEISYVLVSTSPPIEYIPAVFVPFPIETKWDDGASVTMITMPPTMDHFVVRGKGFKPGEEVSTVSVSGKEKIPAKVKVLENGEWTSKITPAATQAASGTSKLHVKRKNGQNRTLEYAYGPRVQ